MVGRRGIASVRYVGESFVKSAVVGRSWGRAALAAMVGALLAASAVLMGGIAPVAADPAPTPSTAGSISGSFRAANGDPLAGEVFAIEPEAGFVYRGESGLDGSYTIERVPAGSYAVQFMPYYTTSEAAPFGYAPAFYRDAPRLEDADLVVVNPGSETLFVDSALQPAGAVTGTVEIAGSHGPVPVEPGKRAVVLFQGDEPPADPVDGEHFWVIVDNDGSYRVAAAAGTYKVAFYTSYAGVWTPELYYDDVQDPALATTVTVESGVATPGIDASLLQAGALEFTLTDPQGAPLEGIEVSIFNHVRPDPTVRSLVTDARGRVLAADLPPGYFDVSVVSTPDRFSRIFVRGMMVFPGETSRLTSALGDPLPEGVTATPGTTTGDGYLLLSGDSVELTVPAAIDLDAVDYAIDSNDSETARRGAFTLDGDVWRATVDLTDLEGHGSLGIEYHFALDLDHLAIIDTVVARTPTASELTPETRGSLTLTAAAAAGVSAGATAVVTGLTPGEWYTAWWFSTPVSAGWLQADAAGALTVPVPAGLAAGEHSLAVLERFGALAGWTPVTVLAADNGGGTGGGGTAGGGTSTPAALAATGADPAPFALASASLLALGLALALAPTRARRAGSRTR